VNQREAKRLAHRTAAYMIRRWLQTDWAAELGERGGFSEADCERLELVMGELEAEHRRKAE
jgi:hypothetical protein